MGQSTNGELWYGFVFEDGYEFPWGSFDGDEEDWWRAEQGIDATKDYPAEGWLEYQKEFDASHPRPFEVVNYCSGDYPMYGLALRGTVQTAYRGSPQRIEKLEPVPENAELLRSFLEKYDLEPDSEVGWWLSSYWG